jgi:hypothetical protein
MPTKSTWFGVVLAIFGTIISAIGNHFIQKSHQVTSSTGERGGSSTSQTKKGGGNSTIDLSSQVYFWFGNICVTLLGTTLGILALTYAPQSLISPLGGLTIVWNLMLAMIPFFGGIRPKSIEYVATSITLLGTVIIVWLGPENRGQKNTFWLFLNPKFGLLVLIYSGIGALLESASRSQNKLYRRISSGATGGIVGGLSNVFAKSAADFYSGNHVIDEQHDFGTFALVVIIALGLAISQLMFLNSALANYAAVQVVPIYQTTLIIFATISGGVAFDEFGGFSLLQYVGFSFGVCISVIGVAVLASSSSTTTAEDLKD